MIDEEKEAIETVKGITTDDLLNYWEGPEEPYEAIQIVLNLIQKQSKVIDKMAEQLDDYTAEGYEKPGKERIKQYFYGKVENE